jgi:hypothetical protein
VNQFRRFAALASLLIVAVSFLRAESQVRDSSYPVFVAARTNPNDYSAFATSGWDGNWYVGSNTAWVKKISAIPAGRYKKAYIGAKLGRAKLLPPEGRPPLFKAIPGSIFVAIASTPAWSANNKYLLTTTHDIPSEGSPEYPLEITGESQWFWTQVPIADVNLQGDNYAAIWSDTPGFTSVSSAPVIAAAVGGTDTGTWIINSLKGELPEKPVNPPGTAITFFQPAIAMKLIPAEAPTTAPKIRLISWTPGTTAVPRPVITASIEGDSIERAWVEYVPAHSKVSAPWEPVGRPLWKAPFIFSVAQEELPPGPVRLRIAAVNVWEVTGISDSFSIEVSAIPVPKKK